MQFSNTKLISTLESFSNVLILLSLYIAIYSLEMVYTLFDNIYF